MYNLPKILKQHKNSQTPKKIQASCKNILGILQSAQFSWATRKNSQVPQATQTFSIVWKTSQCE